MRLPARLVRLFSVAVFLLTALYVSIADAQSFTTTGSMALPRACQTATPLQDGTVLVAGGSSSSGSTSTAEIYSLSAAAQVFTPTGSMHIARGCGVIAVGLNDGTVLIFGGSGDTSAEIYNPISRTFGLTAGAMTTIRSGATGTLLQDGTVLITGGDNVTGENLNILSSAEIYSPATGTFTATRGPMSSARVDHTATLLANGTVLIAGGQPSAAYLSTSRTAEIYNPSTQQFTSVGQMTVARTDYTATLLTDGTVLLAGGRDSNGNAIASAEIYTPANSTFAGTGSMNSARCFHNAVSLADGMAMVIGGASSTSTINSAELYNPSTRTFAATGNMTVPRYVSAAAILYDGQVLVAGGVTDPPNSISAAELYSYPVTIAKMDPAYRVTSILYAPPGNKSQDGYTNTTSAGTTTTIGSSFTHGSSVTMGSGFKAFGLGVNASETFGTSSTSSNSAAFQETYTNATGVANQSSSTAADAINHNNDLFLIWLNPELTVFGNETNPVSYNVGIQPLADGTTPQPDIVEVYASAMEANAVGVTTVPASILNQITTPSGQNTPGLASICKNLIQAEYAAGTCSLSDQCGCTAADFLPILQTDPLLFLNGLSNPISPYPATTSPLAADGPNQTVCGTLPVTPGSNCRYVPVPSEIGSTQQEGVTLEGPNTVGGNNPTNTFMQGENTQTTYTLSGQNQTTVNQTVSVSFNTPTSPSPASFSIGDTFGLTKTMTWIDSQGVATVNSLASALSVTLSSSTVGCAQENNIAVFEDTIYHTFVFQQPPNDPSTCTVPTATTTAATINETQVLPGQSAQVSVHVSCNSACGSVDYRMDGGDWGTLPLDANGNSSALTSNTLALGPHTVVIGYMGNGSYSPSTSNTLNFTVTNTTVTATINETQVLPGQSAQVSVHVSCNSACGSVDYRMDGGDWGTLPLDANGNSSALTSTSLALGPHTVVINYLGSGSYSPSTSNTLNFTVTNTTVTATINETQVLVGQSAQVSVHVSCNSACGSVDYRMDGGDWGTLPLDANGNSSSPTSTTLAVGSHTVVINYLGSGSYSPSTSNTLNFTVVNPTVTATINETQVLAGQSAQVSVHVSCNSACGNVDYRMDGGDWGTLPLDANGNSSSPTSTTLAVGSHTVVINYLGSGSTVLATSNTLNFTVTNTTVTATINETQVFAGQSAVVSVHVSCNSACGSVDYRMDGGDWGTLALDANGNSSSPTSTTLGAGSHTVVINYLGSGSYSPSTSNTLNFTVVNPTVTATINETQVLAGQSAVVSVHVSCNSACGNVDYRMDGGDWGTLPLDANGNSSAITSNTLGLGSHTAVINYLGNGSTVLATSNTLNFTVTNATVTATINETQVPAGQSALVSVHVSCNSACGSVDYLMDGADWGTLPLDANGNSSAPTSTTLGVGSHTVVINYLGNSSYSTATSNTLNFTVTD
jgi:hypothetical protein